MSDLMLRADVSFASADDNKPATFAGTAYTGQPVKANGFPVPIIVDLSGLEVPNKAVPVLRGHDQDRVIGHGTVSKSDSEVTISGVMSGSNSHTQEVVESSKLGQPWELSIGSSILKTEQLGKGKTTIVNGRQITGPAIIARKARLNEVSIVALGADRDTSVSIAAKAADNSQKEKQSMPKCDDVASEIEAGAERVEALELTAKRYGDNPAVAKLLEAAIADDTVDAKDFEIACLRASRPTVNNRNTGRGEGITDKVFEAGLCLSMGIQDSHDEQTLELADRTFRGGLGLSEFLMRACEANGHRVHSARDTKALLQGAFGQAANFSGFSTVDVGGVLSNVANKSAISYFNGIEQTWRQIAKIGSVRDFKQNSLYGITGASDTTFKQLANGGEIQHGTLSEYGYSVKADRYARMLTLSEIDLINDDLGVLDSAAAELGVGAAEAINELFWTTYKADTNFYSIANDNLIDDLLDADGLDAAEQAMRAQKKPNGQPLGVRPSILLVGPDLHNTALRLMNAMGVVGDTDREDINIFRGRYSVVSSDYVASKAWYLLASPVRPTVHVVFRDGVSSPRVERAAADFNTYGISMRGCVDFGVAFGEYRFGVKSDSSET